MNRTTRLRSANWATSVYVPPPGAASFHQGRPLVSRASSPRQVWFVGGIIGTYPNCPQFQAESARRTHARTGTWSLWPDSNRRPLRAISSPWLYQLSYTGIYKSAGGDFYPAWCIFSVSHCFVVWHLTVISVYWCAWPRGSQLHTPDSRVLRPAPSIPPPHFGRGGRLDCHTLTHRRSIIHIAGSQSLSAANAVFSDRCFLAPCWSYPSWPFRAPLNKAMVKLLAK